MEGLLSADWLSAFARVVAPVSPVPLSGQALLVVGLLIVGGVVAFAFMVRGVGFHPVVTTAFCLAALGVASESAAVAQPAPNATLAVNYAGFVLPVVLSVLFLVSGRAPVVRAAVVVAVSSVVSFVCSEAIPHEGVLLYYRWPAVVAGSLGALLAWGSWKHAGPLAFVGGASGVIIGADLFHLSDLITPSGSHRIILGGAGVMDGIFIVGLLGVLVAAFWHSVFIHVQRLRGVGVEAEPEEAPREARRRFGAGSRDSG